MNHSMQCHCYVCDSPAPCNYWGDGNSSTDHCHSTDKGRWQTLRRTFKKWKMAATLPQILTSKSSVNIPPSLDSVALGHSSLKFNLISVQDQIHYGLALPIATQSQMQSARKTSINLALSRIRTRGLLSNQPNPSHLMVEQIAWRDILVVVIYQLSVSCILVEGHAEGKHDLEARITDLSILKQGCSSFIPLLASPGNSVDQNHQIQAIIPLQVKPRTMNVSMYLPVTAADTTRKVGRINRLAWNLNLAPLMPHRHFKVWWQATSQTNSSHGAQSASCNEQPWSNGRTAQSPEHDCGEFVHQSAFCACHSGSNILKETVWRLVWIVKVSTEGDIIVEPYAGIMLTRFLLSVAPIYFVCAIFSVYLVCSFYLFVLHVEFSFTSLFNYWEITLIHWNWNRIIAMVLPGLPSKLCCH